MNPRYNLDGEGRENSREEYKLAVRTIRHLVASDEIGTTPSKLGNKSKISRKFLKLVTLHVNME